MYHSLLMMDDAASSPTAETVAESLSSEDEVLPSDVAACDMTRKHSFTLQWRPRGGARAFTIIINILKALTVII